MSLQETGLELISAIAESNPDIGYRLLVGFLPLSDLGCESTVELETTVTKADKLEAADDICEELLVELIKTASKITELKDLITTAGMMKCGG